MPNDIAAMVELRARARAVSEEHTRLTVLLALAEGAEAAAWASVSACDQGGTSVGC